MDDSADADGPAADAATLLGDDHEAFHSFRKGADERNG